MSRSRICQVCKVEKRDYCFSKWFSTCKPCRSKAEGRRQRLPAVRAIRHLYRRHRYNSDPIYREIVKARARREYWQKKERRGFLVDLD